MLMYILINLSLTLGHTKVLANHYCPRSDRLNSRINSIKYAAKISIFS